MSLVAYDDSGESGIESEDEDLPSRPVTVKKEPATDNSSSSEDGSEKASVSKNIINDENQAAKPNAPRLIPIPSTHMTSINFDMKILDKNRSQPIRITIPSLKDFEEEEPKKPKLKPSTKGSSLFSMLPAPKNVTSSASSSLMPQSVAKAIKPKPKPVRRPTGRTPVPATVKTQQLVEEDESSEPVVSFFFSGAENEPLPPPIDFDLETSTVVGDSTPSASAAPMNQQTPVVSANSQILDSGQFASVGAHEDPPSESSFHSHPEEDTALLDTEALKKLCGSRDRKKGPDLSEIIEVSGSSLVGDASMILAKELSKEQPSHSFKRKSECSSVQRRKHQITYLAEQAKAQELELRNNWAQNRVTRKQTQAKYGF